MVLQPAAILTQELLSELQWSRSQKPLHGPTSGTPEKTHCAGSVEELPHEPTGPSRVSETSAHGVPCTAGRGCCDMRGMKDTPSSSGHLTSETKGMARLTWIHTRARTAGRCPRRAYRPPPCSAMLRG